MRCIPSMARMFYTSTKIRKKQSTVKEPIYEFWCKQYIIPPWGMFSITNILFDGNMKCKQANAKVLCHGTTWYCWMICWSITYWVCFNICLRHTIYSRQALFIDARNTWEVPFQQKKVCVVGEGWKGRHIHEGGRRGKLCPRFLRILYSSSSVPIMCDDDAEEHTEIFTKHYINALTCFTNPNAHFCATFVFA